MRLRWLGVHSQSMFLVATLYIYNIIYIYIVNSIICLEGMPLLHQHLPDVPTYVGSTIRGSSWSEKTAWPRLVDGCRVEGTNREV